MGDGFKSNGSKLGKKNILAFFQIKNNNNLNILDKN